MDFNILPTAQDHFRMDKPRHINNPHSKPFCLKQSSGQICKLSLHTSPACESPQQSLRTSTTCESPQQARRTTLPNQTTGQTDDTPQSNNRQSDKQQSAGQQWTESPTLSTGKTWRLKKNTNQENHPGKPKREEE